MVTKVYSVFFVFFIFLLFCCTKKKEGCPKAGYEYITSLSKCRYSPTSDSIPLNSTIYIEATLPKIFVDENSNTTVFNIDGKVEGPLDIIMLFPLEEGAVENFEIIPKIGAVIKDSIHASSGQLKSFRTLIWDAHSRDSFSIKIELKALVRGVYGFSIGQQSSRDKDCALYKYFLKVGNTDQHLNYLAQYNNGYVSDYERNFAYCFKVY